MFVLFQNRIGAVIHDDRCGGVFRGHVDVWFGEYQTNGVKPSVPVLRQVLASECVEVESPLGYFMHEDPSPVEPRVQESLTQALEKKK